ncbi:MAG: tetratricopeptide repeat protein [Pigmentiphaga sp.]|uniref:tetratricopeptide repeat protein n=1 Tax=Pigmentiphaga sp. TaxID=1977564 RepID=UPI0029B9646E|nr:tetratricopeptide repeat protein [Pigmentiphaga sp.]MDX3907743.1 tetratricopeptide repeat protein [Pigmentiphaga sp.]
MMYRGAVRFAGLAGWLLLAAGCSSTPAPGGYGMSAPRFSDEAILRQQVANQEPAADSRGMYLSLIREMQNKGLYFASLAHIDAFEQRHGVAPDIELLRGHALREAGQDEQSAAVYRKLLKTEVGAGAAQGLGLLAGARGDYGAAVKSLREAARLDPTNALIASDLGYALLRQGDTAGARLPLAQAAELAPDHPKILANLALLMLVSGDSERAGTVMTKAGLSTDARAAVRKLAYEIARQQPSSAAGGVVRQMPAPMAQQARSRPDSAPVLPPMQAPMQSMLDRFSSNSP